MTDGRPHLAHYVEDLPTVGLADLQAAFRVCAASTVISLVGNSEKIRAAL
jgi:hypothetical protein